MAERLLAHALAAEEEPLRSLKVISAGVSAFGGEAPSANSVTAMHKVGIDLSDHRSRPVTPQDLEKAVVIFCMTESHRQILQAHYGTGEIPVLLFRELMPGGVEKQVPDPFGMNLRAYETCRDSLVEAVPSILKYLREEIQPTL